ncbi:MAG TPA: hypothetical protein VN783_04560, partial [Thermoanaerobaculia bacterium]|nr:hypothetical protein [Thermoanaerobaculia bacterium]
MTFLLVAAIAAFFEEIARPRAASLAALSVFAMAAVLVKQNALVYCAAFAIGLFLCVGFRRAAVFAGLTGGALGLGVPFALKGEFPPFRIEPFGADAPGWPPATGMHTRPTGWVRRQGG